MSIWFEWSTKCGHTENVHSFTLRWVRNAHSTATPNGFSQRHQIWIVVQRTDWHVVTLSIFVFRSHFVRLCVGGGDASWSFRGYTDPIANFSSSKHNYGKLVDPVPWAIRSDSITMENFSMSKFIGKAAAASWMELTSSPSARISN